jgi:hypothetical protein
MVDSVEERRIGQREVGDMGSLSSGGAAGFLELCGARLLRSNPEGND